MGVCPSYYRQVGDIYPHETQIFTQAGAFPPEIEYYLGQAGADSIYILNRHDPKGIYTPFVRYQHQYEFVDYTKPRVNAFHDTFVVPLALGKKTLKSGKNFNPLAPFISLIGSLVIFASLYMLVRDAKIISNSVKLIQKSQNIHKLLAESKEEKDPLSKSLDKVVQLRDKIYKRNLASAIVSVAMTAALIAASVLAIAAAIASTYPLLIGASAAVGALLLGHSIKTIVEWKGRLDKSTAKEVLEHAETLRIARKAPNHKLKQRFA